VILSERYTESMLRMLRWLRPRRIASVASSSPREGRLKGDLGDGVWN
jgi:hypothetical protein